MRPRSTPANNLGSIKAAGLHANFSRHAIPSAAWQQMTEFAHKSGLERAIADTFSGSKFNNTEDRAVLHTALRRPTHQSLLLDGIDIMQSIQQTHDQMESITEQLHSGDLMGAGGVPITDVVHLGIGGSDLGPVMLHQALSPYKQTKIDFHFFGNVDLGYLQQQLSLLNPATTLVIIVSKSFRTYETLTNASLTKKWMLEAGLDTDQVDNVFYAVTSNLNEAKKWGVRDNRVLPLWDWVGGRFSMWSAVGLSIAMMIGMDHFRDLLAGAHAMDVHFQSAAFDQNIPVTMGLLGVWYGAVMQVPTQAIVAYSEYLRYFKDYCQQQQMESLGKRVSSSGELLEYPTGSIIWGGVGSNTQHSFHQLLMQGSHMVPIDFILPLYNHSGTRNDDLIANCLAQSEVLWNGESESSLHSQAKSLSNGNAHLESLIPHRVIPGGMPSSLISMQKLDPHSLGALVALYEHSVLVKGVLLGINPYDQWGVESGKKIATSVLAALHADTTDVIGDEITSNLLKTCGITK